MGDEAGFKDLHTIIKANDQYGNHALKTVFAAYMNYDKAGSSTGEFNTPGVLLTDAVIFALEALIWNWVTTCYAASTFQARLCR